MENQIDGGEVPQKDQRDVQVDGNVQYGEGPSSEKLPPGGFSAGVDISGKFADLLHRRLTSPVPVTLAPKAPQSNRARLLWSRIREHTQGISFDAFGRFLELALCTPGQDSLADREPMPEVVVRAEDAAQTARTNATSADAALIERERELEDAIAKGTAQDKAKARRALAVARNEREATDNAKRDAEARLAQLQKQLRRSHSHEPRLKRLRGVCPPDAPFPGFIPGADMYEVLKLAAEMFLLLRCGVCEPVSEVGEEQENGWWANDLFADYQEEIEADELEETLARFLGNDRRSYIRAIIQRVFPERIRVGGGGSVDLSPFCPAFISLSPCLLELIWSYWHEEGMLVQTANAVALRFQNVRAGKGRDPLAELEIDPLRPLSGLLWGYIQDEQHRLTVARRAYEYNHHYGLTLFGKAVPDLRPADPRSKFLQAFHDLLRMTDAFYREAADNTVTPDPFPLLIALRDLHLILAEGAHNQFRDLPWTARAEMLVQQWILARPEIRDFLRGRLMVPYPEEWMGAVDAMKKLQGWTDTNIIHFRDLGVYGERILLSVRYVEWNDIDNPEAAADWAREWRPEVQGYVHAYRMATGVTLTDEVVEVSRTGDARYLPPSFHLRNRLQEQRPGGRALTEGGTGARLQLGAVPRPASRER